MVLIIDFPLPLIFNRSHPCGVLTPVLVLVDKSDCYFKGGGVDLHMTQCLLFCRVLASLNLPAAIEDVSGDTVPQSILTKSTSVVEQGGIQTVDQLIKELPELLQRNREILEEVCLKRWAFQVETAILVSRASRG